MFLNDCHGAVQNLLVYGIGGKHLCESLWLLAELLLQKNTRVYQIVAARNQQIGVERFGDVIVRTDAQSLDVLFDGSPCSEQHHGDMAGVEVTFYLFAQFRSRHVGHYYIADYDIGHFAAHQCESFRSVGRSQHFVEGLEDTCQHVADGVVVFHYQDFCIRESFDGSTLFQLRLEQGIVFRFGNFYLLHTVCILVYLLFVKLCVPQLQVYDEAATFAQFAFHTDGAVMELHDTLRQCQADTRTRLACICRVHLVYLVEAVEYLVHFPGIYAAAGIGHTDDGIAAFGLDAEGDAVFRLGMLDGVGQQVVYHFLHLFLVIPYFEAVCFLLEVEADLFGAGIFQEKQIVFV